MSEHDVISPVAGNASDLIKSTLAKPPSRVTFGDDVLRRLRLVEVSIHQKSEEPQKMEGRVVLESEVAAYMLNGGGNLHGGCSALLIDNCSSMALAALNMASMGTAVSTVSLALNIVYHSPAGLGDTIRVINNTLTLGARAHSVRTEIWNVTKHRLVASGVHIKMVPSPSPRPKL